MTIVCARCSTPSTTRRQGIPWCTQCRIWLVHDEVTGEWISFAEHAHRQPVYQRRQAIAATRDAARAAQSTVVALLPAGWRTRLGEPAHGGCYTLDLHPPTAPVDVYGYLVPPIGGYAWRIPVYHRGIGVCRTLFLPGTATPATFPQAADAVPTALAAVDEARTTAPVAPSGATS
jgi:hypothetical protein